MKTMKTAQTIAFALVLALPAMAAAHEPGGMGGMGGAGGMGGPGMLAVADDGSVLVTEMTAGMMGGGGPGQAVDRELLNITAAGQVRWRASFDDGWPMMPVTNGDLVVLALRDDWWMGGGMGGDGDPPGGGGGGGGGMPGGGPHADTVTLVGLDLATGAERWRTEIDGDMASIPEFAPDGSGLYLTVRDMGMGVQMPVGPMHQGDAPTGDMLMSTSVVALDRSGSVLWTVDLSGGMMP
jgi:outer membrane protein assembly factor BamB